MPNGGFPDTAARTPNPQLLISPTEVERQMYGVKQSFGTTRPHLAGLG